MKTIGKILKAVKICVTANTLYSEALFLDVKRKIHLEKPK